MWDGLRTILISSAGAYAIAKFLRGSPYMGWAGFVFLMGHLSVNQIARMRATDPHAVDITGAQMVLVMKLSSFCWNVADGAVPEADLTDLQKDRRLKELPGFLDFLGYVFFFPSLFAGPAFDFVEYRRWLDLSMFDVPANIDPAKKPPTRRKRKIPRSATPAMKKLAIGLLWIFIHVQLSAHFYPEVLTEPTYKQHGFLQRVLTLHMVPLTARTKYYGVWTLTEGACILAGLGYNGVDPSTGQVSWDRLVNIHPLGLELAQNTRAYLENWNINTNHWLRNCVYLRVTPKGKKPGFRASMATFTTSAIWHGFYPGYYMSFILASLVQTVAKSTPLPTPPPLSQNVNPLPSRLPPILPPLLPPPAHPGPPPLQALLRCLLLARHPIHLFLRHCALPRAHAKRLARRLGEPVFLRRRRHARELGVFCVACEAGAQEEVGGACRRRGEGRWVAKVGEHREFEWDGAGVRNAWGCGAGLG